MTVSSEVNSVSYSGNGSTQIFAVPYYFLADSHLRVVLRDADGTETVQTITTNYTVIGAGNQAGGQVTMTVAPVSGETLVILRNVPATQETDYVANDPFPAESHERALDKLTMIAQQGEFSSSRALRVPDSDPEPQRLPPSAQRANLLLSFDNYGQPVAIAPSSGSAAELAINLADQFDPLKGAALIGYKGRTLAEHLSDFVNAKDFGAVGDGVTDDTAALQAVFNTYSSVYMPAGTYLVGMLALRNNLQILGAGQENTIILHKPGTNTYGLYGNNVNNVRIESLTLNGNSANNPLGGMGMRIEGSSSNIKISDVRSTDWKFDGIANVASGSFFDVVSCRIDNNGRDGVSCTSVTDVLVMGNRIVGNGRFGTVFGAGCNKSRLLANVLAGNSATDALGAGALAVNCTDVTFVGNLAAGNVLGHGLQFNTVSRGVMSGNVSRGNGTSGLDSYTSRYVTISGNISFLNAIRGIEVDSGAYYNTVNANVAYRNGEVGISIYRTPNTTLIGNYATENGTTGLAKYGIRLWDSANTLPSSDCRLIGNVCSDDRGGSATQTHGVSLENVASNTTMIANRLTPNLTGAVNLVSGSFAFCEANQGYSVPPSPLTLQASWVAYDAAWSAPASYIDASGIVSVSGVMKNGTTTIGTVVATLPVGQRPAKTEGPFRTYTDAGSAAFYVQPNGDIVALTALSATRTALGGITFKAA